MKAGQALRKAAASASAKSRYPPLPPGWTAVIGIETHAQLCPDFLESPPSQDSNAAGPSGSKLFSDARLVPTGTLGPAASSSGSAGSVAAVAPNSLVTPFDAAFPGTLPRRLQGGEEATSSGAVHQAVRTALALRCRDIDSASSFDRKHYFYPDLTSGYQITQKYKPLAKNGTIPLLFDDGHLPSKEDELDVEVECIQLEQDTAKSAHVQTQTQDSTDLQTLIDLNRSGCGLMEIVSGPNMRTPEQAGAYIRKLQETLRAIGASDGNMDEGSLRCDVNVSVFRPGRQEPWGVRTEIKNLNSAKFVMQAISHETHRQVQVIEEDEAQGRIPSSIHDEDAGSRALQQETRGFDEKTGTTFRLRSKEQAPEYRFMPDPNLAPLALTESFIDSVRARLPELPDATRRRLMQSYSLSVREANVLIRASSGTLTTPLAESGSQPTIRTAVEYFEALARLVKPKVAINWTINELMKSLNAHELGFEACPVPPSSLAELLALVEQRRITGTVAKTLLPELVSNPELLNPSVTALLESRGVLSPPAATDPAQGGHDDASDTNLSLCKTIIDDFPVEAKLIRAGKHKIVMKLVGEAMKRTRGTADAVRIRELFVELLSDQ
ncbi:hypothetical protein OC834_004254 [Tilletia horrida]|nr:hypothetical protein OC834_004254 [Tilletia horrida]